MSDRAGRLHDEAARQIQCVLRELESLSCSSRLHEPCPGREKLGNGTIAAVCGHVADIYERIARFAGTGNADLPPAHGRASAADAHVLAARLRSALGSVAVLGTLEDDELDAVPYGGAFRFADGQRTLEQVLAGLLRHQGHQVEAILRALAD